MAQHLRFSIWSAAALVGVMTLGSALYGQDPVPPEGSGRSRADYWIETGVMKRITPDPQRSETFTAPRPIVELIANSKVPDWEPNFAPKSDTLREKALRAIYRRDIWNLEFSFKPLRMIEVDVPQPSGKLQRKKLWYLVYRVKNNGYHLGVKAEEDDWKHKTFTTQLINQPVYFFPHFVMQATVEETRREGGERRHEYVKKEYLDRVIPAAMKPIADRERLGAPLYDSVSITKVAIPVSDDKVDRGVWGVAIWEDIDARTDYFSIFVQGLTNAYQFEDPEGAYKDGDPPGTGRKFTQKNLQLNFHRQGDQYLQHENEVRYGLPLDPTRQEEILEIYGMTEPLDYQWVYR